MTNAITTTVATRTVVGNLTLVVGVENTTDQSALVRITTAYGTKDVALGAKEKKTAAFTTRVSSIPSGVVDVEATFVENVDYVAAGAQV